MFFFCATATAYPDWIQTTGKKFNVNLVFALLCLLEPALRIHGILVRIRIRDPYLWLTDLDPAISISDLQDGNEKFVFPNSFRFLLFDATYTSFFKYKKSLRSHETVGNKAFLLFCLIMEGSGSEPRTTGSGSGSRRPENIRIRVRNTGLTDYPLLR